MVPYSEFMAYLGRRNKASQVVQWYRIHLPMQQTPWSRKIARATKQLSQWATTIEPARDTGNSTRAHVLQLLEPASLEPVLYNNISQQHGEACTLQLEGSPSSL